MKENAQTELLDMKNLLAKKDKEKTINDQALIKRIREVEDKVKNSSNSNDTKLGDIQEENEALKKELKLLRSENNSHIKTKKKLEETVKHGYEELDKQVQLKEKFAEEKKILKEIIATHQSLKSLHKDFAQVMKDQQENLNISSTNLNKEQDNRNSEEEWEDIDANEEALNDKKEKRITMTRRFLK